MSSNFWIAIRFQQRTYRYYVTYELLNERTEQFLIKAKNKTVTFQSNRPYLKSNPGLKKWAPKYEIISGELNNMYFKELIVQALNNYLKSAG